MLAQSECSTDGSVFVFRQVRRSRHGAKLAVVCAKTQQYGDEQYLPEYSHETPTQQPGPHQGQRGRLLISPDPESSSRTPTFTCPHRLNRSSHLEVTCLNSFSSLLRLSYLKPKSLRKIFQYIEWFFVTSIHRAYWLSINRLEKKASCSSSFLFYSTRFWRTWTLFRQLLVGL